MVQGRARARQRFLPARFVKHFMLFLREGHHVSYFVPLMAFEARFQASRALVRAPNMVFLRLPHAVTKSFLQARASAVSAMTMAPGPASRNAAPAAARQNCLIIYSHSKVSVSIGFIAYHLPAPQHAAAARMCHAVMTALVQKHGKRRPSCGRFTAIWGCDAITTGQIVGLLPTCAFNPESDLLDVRGGGITTRDRTGK